MAGGWNWMSLMLLPTQTILWVCDPALMILKRLLCSIFVGFWYHLRESIPKQFCSQENRKTLLLLVSNTSNQRRPAAARPSWPQHPLVSVSELTCTQGGLLLWILHTKVVFVRQDPHFYHSKGNTCSFLPTKPLVQAILPMGSTPVPRQAATPSVRRPLGWPYSKVLTPLHPPIEPKPSKGEAATSILPSRKPKPSIVATKQLNATITARPKPHTTVTAQNWSRHSQPQPRVPGIRGVIRKTWDQHTFPFKMPNLAYTQNGTS